ncbi:MAG TPA: zf-HC2 domain-containing protein [Steroidobacteraceae bacterium]|nr:zf-HC2 domain-containing protein [Steroidobacteraceae bacterium]
MIVSDEMLMAYLDGELDGENRAAVERAMAADTEVAARIARHRALREKLRAAYGPILEEPVPEQLIDAVRTSNVDPARAKVIPLRAFRAPAVPRWSAREWSALAASLIVGALVSALALRSLNGTPVESMDGRLIARGTLARALTNELASRPKAGAPVAIGITFLSKSGDYCRTFTLAGREAIAGLACRDHDAWQIETLTRSEAAAASGGAYRLAASPIPRPILDAVSAAMAGEPLDASAEAAARTRTWTRP